MSLLGVNIRNAEIAEGDRDAAIEKLAAAEERIAELEARVAECEAALEPFAEAKVPTNAAVGWSLPSEELDGVLFASPSVFRRAAKVLAGDCS